ncbi:hypothetical protein ACWDF1_18860 [Streptomyces coelicoflavus]|uniref:hypothetical protein n=1 Tax=Streptomyces TaxID=1883 RepID=UPI001D177056|nr:MULTISPECIES: hypothetical protein [Streptomyces]MCW1097680.1 hypothetical protein [Streptomyces sp. RS2]
MPMTVTGVSVTVVTMTGVVVIAVPVTGAAMTGVLTAVATGLRAIVVMPRVCAAFEAAIVFRVIGSHRFRVVLSGLSVPVLSRGAVGPAPVALWCGQPSAAGFEDRCHLVGRHGSHAHARPRHVLPQPFQRRTQPRAVRTRHQHQVGSGRGRRRRPVPGPQFLLGGQPHRRTARRGHQQDAWPGGRCAGQGGGQAHRSAPSRHA